MEIIEFFNILKEVAIMVPFLAGIVQVVKKALRISNDWVPALAIILGILIYIPFGGITLFSVWIGAALGLMASGLYDNIKIAFK